MKNDHSGQSSPEKKKKTDFSSHRSFIENSHIMNLSALQIPSHGWMSWNQQGYSMSVRQLLIGHKYRSHLFSQSCLGPSETGMSMMVFISIRIHILVISYGLAIFISVVSETLRQEKGKVTQTSSVLAMPSECLADGSRVWVWMDYGQKSRQLNGRDSGNFLRPEKEKKLGTSIGTKCFIRQKRPLALRRLLCQAWTDSDRIIRDTLDEPVSPTLNEGIWCFIRFGPF
jgi:hypothetical protein